MTEAVYLICNAKTKNLGVEKKKKKKKDAFTGKCI